ncbi:NAD(P)-binding protein [Glonium stellatum]|uniref:NAD(P)-binding protein n=1 Tax=Glonium stellatum TaxID=574774 RepID=A0A8E2F7P5_9PEZI|nr:NAD(P)-binding protein [Glonium stellatum]
MRAVWANRANLKNPLASVRNDVRRVPEVPKGWVKVKVAAVGLNYHDIFTLRGLGMHKLTFPLTLGNEGAGFLDDGMEIIIFPVMGDPNFKGDLTLDPKRHVLGELTQGALAEYVVVPEENVIKKPKELSMLTASVLGIAYLTAYRMLFGRSGLKIGQKMLVQGSTGGVATALIQLGRAAGMTVWCTGRTEEKRMLAMKLGAHRTFEAGEELPEKVGAVFDMSGAQTWSHSLDSVATGGTIVTCGLHSGSKVEMDLLKVFTEQVNIHGSYAGNREDFEEMVAFVAEHKIEPHIPVVLPLEKAEEGLRMILEGKVQGKVVVKV